MLDLAIEWFDLKICFGFHSRSWLPQTKHQQILVNWQPVWATETKATIKSGCALQKYTLKIHHNEKLSVYQNANKQSYVVWSCLRICLRKFGPLQFLFLSGTRWFCLFAYVSKPTRLSDTVLFAPVHGLLWQTFATCSLVILPQTQNEALQNRNFNQQHMLPYEYVCAWTTQVFLSAFSHSEKKTNSVFPHTQAFLDENKKMLAVMFSKMFFSLFFWSYKIKAVQRNQALNRRKKSSLDGIAFHYQRNNNNSRNNSNNYIQTYPCPATCSASRVKRQFLLKHASKWRHITCLHVFSLALGFETPYHQKLCCTYEQAGPAHRLISAKTKCYVPKHKGLAVWNMLLIPARGLFSCSLPHCRTILINFFSAAADRALGMVRQWCNSCKKPG